MNILFIVPSLYGGGAERVVTRLASALCEKHHVYILSTWPEGNRGGTYTLDPRIVTHEMHLPDESPAADKETRFPNRLFRRIRRAVLRRVPKTRALLWWKEMRRLKKLWSVDVSISFLTSCNYDNVMSRTGERVIISVRSILKNTIPEDPKAARRERFRIRFAARHADHIVAVSRNVGLEQVKEYGAKKKKISVIYNPIDPASLREKALKEAEDPVFSSLRESHRHLLITAGRLTAQKAHWHLIRAFREVHAKFPDTALVILGQGEFQPALQKLTDALGLSEHVLLAGFHPEPFCYMSCADIFVLPSLFEGFSNALLEAMALGLPLVACDCNSGPRELFAPKTDSTLSAKDVEEAPYGILTPVCSGDLSLLFDESKYEEPCTGEEMCLAEAIDRLLSDKKLAEHYRKQSLIRAEDFSPDKIVRKWERLIDTE